MLATVCIACTILSVRKARLATGPKPSVPTMLGQLGSTWKLVLQDREEGKGRRMAIRVTIDVEIHVCEALCRGGTRIC